MGDVLLFLGMIGFAVGIFLCFACYKYRKLSKCLFYFECIIGMIYSMIATEEQD